MISILQIKGHFLRCSLFPIAFEMYLFLFDHQNIDAFYTALPLGRNWYHNIDKFPCPETIIAWNKYLIVNASVCLSLPYIWLIQLELFLHKMLTLFVIIEQVQWPWVIDIEISQSSVWYWKIQTFKLDVWFLKTLLLSSILYLILFLPLFHEVYIETQEILLKWHYGLYAKQFRSFCF